MAPRSKQTKTRRAAQLQPQIRDISSLVRTYNENFRLDPKMHNKSRDGAPNTKCHSCKPCCDLRNQWRRVPNKQKLVELHSFNRIFLYKPIPAVLIQAKRISQRNARMGLSWSQRIGVGKYFSSGVAFRVGGERKGRWQRGGRQKGPSQAA